MYSTVKKTIKKLLEEVEFIISDNNALLEISIYQNKIDDHSYYNYSRLAFYWDSINRTSKVLDNHKDSKAFWYLYIKRKRLIDNYFLKNILTFDELEKYTNKFKKIRDKHLCHIDKKSLNNPDEIFVSADIRFGPFNIFINQFLSLLLYLHKYEFKIDYVPKIYKATDLAISLREKYSS